MSDLPNQWHATKLGNLVNVIRGVTFPASAKSYEPNDSYIPCLRTSHIQRDLRWDDVYLIPASYVKRDEQILRRGDILMSMANSANLVGKVCINDTENVACFGAFLAAIRCSHVEHKYVYYFLRSEFAQSYLKNTASQTVNIANISVSELEELTIPLPPLSEQARIVNALDGLLAQVVALKARLDTLPTQIKRFRQSVLSAAVSGQLTEKWRERNNENCESKFSGAPAFSIPDGYKRLSKQKFKIVNRDFTPPKIPESWSIISIADLYEANAIIDFADGNHGSLYPRAEEFGSSGVPFLTASQINESWGVALGDCPKLNSTKAAQLTKGWAESGDVLLTHNATVGRVGILKSEEPVLLGTSVTFYRFHQDAVARSFARIYFSSRVFQEQLEGAMEQTTRNQVPITAQVSLKFVLPPINEQNEINHRVEHLFAFADQLEARLADARQRVDALTQSILAKALRGELVPQDPNDEPASVLLERIAAQRAAEPKPKRGRKAAAH